MIALSSAAHRLGHADRAGMQPGRAPERAPTPLAELPSRQRKAPRTGPRRDRQHAPAGASRACPADGRRCCRVHSPGAGTRRARCRHSGGSHCRPPRFRRVVGGGRFPTARRVRRDSSGGGVRGRRRRRKAGATGQEARPSGKRLVASAEPDALVGAAGEVILAQRALEAAAVAAASPSPSRVVQPHTHVSARRPPPGRRSGDERPRLAHKRRQCRPPAEP